MLGFSTVASSCEQIGDIIGGGGNLCMYGCPSANYVVDVDIKELGTDTPIEGVRVGAVKRHTYNNSTSDAPEIYVDTLASGLTNAVGKVQLKFGGSLQRNFEVVADDIDGTENGGEFASASVEININSTDYTDGDGQWYIGKVTKSAAIKLSKEE